MQFVPSNTIKNKRMQTLLAILLYMQLIQSPGTYSQSQIDQLEIQYQVQIQNIQNDPIQMQEVNEVYRPQTVSIIVIGHEETSAAKPLRDFACETDNTYFKNCR